MDVLTLHEFPEEKVMATDFIPKTDFAVVHTDFPNEETDGNYRWQHGGGKKVTQYGQKFYYRCYDWKSGCRAHKIVVDTPNGKEVSFYNLHNHFPHQTRVIQKRMERMDTTAQFRRRMSGIAIQQLYNWKCRNLQGSDTGISIDICNHGEETGIYCVKEWCFLLRKLVGSKQESKENATEFD